MENTIRYGKERVPVSEDVASFLQTDDRRQAAQDRSDRRHLSADPFGATDSRLSDAWNRPLEELVLQRLDAELLRQTISKLSPDDQRLLYLYYYEERTMEEIGHLLGVSKAAVCKRNKRLLAELGSLMKMGLPIILKNSSFAVNKCSISVLISRRVFSIASPELECGQNEHIPLSTEEKTTASLLPLCLSWNQQAHFGPSG